MARATKTAEWGNRPASPKYRLRLFVSGATPKASEAIANIRTITDKHLEGRYELEVIDALQQSDLLRGQQIVVLPTLIRELPLPMKRLIGDFSDEKRVLIGLGLIPEEQDGRPDNR
jgi:circadian clock protein KaiB